VTFSVFLTRSLLDFSCHNLPIGKPANYFSLLALFFSGSHGNSSTLREADPAFAKLPAMNDAARQRADSHETAHIGQAVSRFRSHAPSLNACGVSLVSAFLLILSFPNFDLWPLAWLSLVPLLLMVARETPWRSFYLGWLFGTAFFYGSCYWLTYSMIHFGGIPAPLAFLLLLPGAVVLGVFPALFALVLTRSIRKWGNSALYLAPLFWPALEWARLETTGQLWNAMGYSQAYHPLLIQTASWGGVYAVGSLIVLVNAALAFIILNRNARSLVTAGVAIALTLTLILMSYHRSISQPLRSMNGPDAVAIAVQPNVPMDLVKPAEDMRRLTSRHFELSSAAINQLPESRTPRLVIWPESPMNFAYGEDAQLREMIARFAQANNASVLLNSQEAAPNDALYNSALLINQEGRLVAQYDKIRLLPFGEYDPLPQWMPGSGLIGGIVGDFTPGTNYRPMPVGNVSAGVFICIEAAYPSIARTFTHSGADVLINISNDGYLGPTAVMRQHLANAVFRAVENGRPLLRVTNTGISAFITPAGKVLDATEGFQPAVRTWSITRSASAATFYTVHGDWFAAACASLSLLALALSFKRTRAISTRGRIIESYLGGSMIETLSIQELRNIYEELRTHVEQLGRFL
jgi:apolipoprotein N-acyltransferase